VTTACDFMIAITDTACDDRLTGGTACDSMMAITDRCHGDPDGADSLRVLSRAQGRSGRLTAAATVCGGCDDPCFAHESACTCIRKRAHLHAKAHALA
jgi:hypothetical protein